MSTKTVHTLIANFGGPRSIQEVAPFLQALLTDQDVIQTPLPKFAHHIFFSYVAKRRAQKISEDYKTIGGKSPIYDDTEALAKQLRRYLSGPVSTFHRYLPATHVQFRENIIQHPCDEIHVFPMFPQFTYATTGSIARWFSKKLPRSVVNKMRWVKSYPAHPAFVEATQHIIRHFLEEQHLPEEETVLLFSAHGVPKKFIEQGDIYQSECEASYHAVMKAFPKSLGKLAYQSKFGRGEWVRPYTIDVCEKVKAWHEGRPNVVFVPISFTSDHIETLFEMETEYMPVIRDQGLNAYRVPAITLDPKWIQAIAAILQESNFCSNQMLIRR